MKRDDDLVDLEGFIDASLPEVVLDGILAVILNGDDAVPLAEAVLSEYFLHIELHVFLLPELALFEQHGRSAAQLHLFEEGDEGGDLHADSSTSSRLRYSCTFRMFR